MIVSPSDSPSLTSYRLRWKVRSPYRILQQKVNYWEKRRTVSNALLNDLEANYSTLKCARALFKTFF